MPDHRAAIRELLARLPFGERGVLLAVLFGSTARGTSHGGSDVDVAFLLEEPFDPRRKLDLIGDVEQAVGRAGIDIVLLNGLEQEQPLLASRILAEGLILWEAAPGVRLGYFLRVLPRAEEARHLLRLAAPLLQARLHG